ncbi:MAG: NgoPII family restriction endonuclease [Bacteroidetes bacterium]|nr:NgoPII family restriction endonuclease [Bacteroidota bacterium]
MTNILEAIINIINNPIVEIRDLYSGRNRIHNVGESLEEFIKDAFANTFHNENENDRLTVYDQEFSWLGNKSNPPDIMLRNGDAIEVKKIESANSDIALNSSYPKSTIQSSSTLITKDCRNCEDWTEKDQIYCVGHISNNIPNSIWFVYGSIYAAGHETYQLIKQKIKDGINEIPNVEFAETKELGRVNRVDPLGITNLRIRGMWHIHNPRRVFDYLHRGGNGFELVAVIPKTKYESFPESSKNKIENSENTNLTINNVRVKNPNNPAGLIDAKLIIFKLN